MNMEKTLKSKNAVSLECVPYLWGFTKKCLRSESQLRNIEILNEICSKSPNEKITRAEMKREESVNEEFFNEEVNIR